MALINTEVVALQKILQRIDTGAISSEEISNRCKVHALIQKQEQLAVQVMALSLANGMTQKKLSAIGLVGKNEIIQTSIPDISNERINCPDMDKSITRGECLDYSGESGHVGDCASCKNFNLTRKLLAPVS